MLKKLGLPEYIFGAAVLIVAASFLTYYLVDLRNFLGLRDAMFTLRPEYFYFDYMPFFFGHWGRNSGPAELLQYSGLAASVVIMAFCAGKVHSRMAIKPGEATVQNKKLFMFLLLMAIGLAVMLMEDAGNIRHTLMGYVQAWAGEPDQGLFGSAFELLYFAMVAGLPLFALLRYGSALKEYARARMYVWIAFAGYFLAASLSFIGTAFSMLMDRDVYTMAGEKFYDFSLRLGTDGLGEMWQVWDAAHWSFQIGFYLMDSLVEESIELIAAGAFVAAAITILIKIKKFDRKLAE